MNEEFSFRVKFFWAYIVLSCYEFLSVIFTLKYSVKKSKKSKKGDSIILTTIPQIKFTDFISDISSIIGHI